MTFRDKQTNNAMRDIIVAVQDRYMSQSLKTVHRLENITRLHTRDGNAYIIDSTCMAMLYTEQHRLLAVVPPPMISGCIKLFYDSAPALIVILTNPVPVYRMRMDDFGELIREKYLWEQVARVCSYYTVLFSVSRCCLDLQNSYELVKALVYEFWALPEVVKKRITLLGFIIDRGRISRSSVMNVLAELRKQGYIQMKKGVLIRIESYKLMD